MIVFSDIDDTLIHRFHSDKSQQRVDKDYTDKEYKLLQEICSIAGFYLCTGKSLSRFSNTLPHHGAIIEDGCYILENGELDVLWHSKIEEHKDRVMNAQQLYAKRNLSIRKKVYSFQIGKEDNGLSEEKIETIKTEIFSLGLNVAESKFDIIGLPIIAGKDQAIRYICDKKQISLDEVIYIGDDLNDYHAMEIVKNVGTLYECHPKIRDLVVQKKGFISEHGYYQGSEEVLQWILNILKCIKRK